jgi:hypothetical protein
MAIQVDTYKKDDQGNPIYEAPIARGRVVGTRVEHNVQIMSDVWCSFVHVIFRALPSEAREIEALRKREKVRFYGPDKVNLTESEVAFAKSQESREEDLKSPWRHVRHEWGDWYSVAFGNDTCTLQGRYEIDAPEDLISQFTAEQADRDEIANLQRQIRAIEDRLNRMHGDRMQVKKGTFVRVVRGRKVPKGTEGKVFWIGADKYARTYSYGPFSTQPMRVGIETEHGKKLFVSLDYVEEIDVPDWPDVIVSTDDFRVIEDAQ